MMVKMTSLMVEGEYQTEFDMESRNRILRGVLLNYYGIAQQPSSPAAQQPSSPAAHNHRQ
ncbi:hypothetical protein [Komagataeibacter medellinensis]|uniref:hypothetical protein n=1 Tax=Komagataeibacter medellinensis TaxID=1177712 RepID=UPI001E4CAC24|nr:hypothetical protein [Komagataeibacter medellinensis]